MKLLISMLGILLIHSAAHSAIIKDETSPYLLKTELTSDGKVTIYKCRDIFIEDELRMQLECVDTPIGNRAFDKDRLVKNIKRLEENEDIRRNVKIGFTLFTAFAIGRNSANSSGHGAVKSSLVFLRDSLIAGAGAYGVSYLFADVLFSPRIESKLGSQEHIIELDSEHTVEELLILIGEAYL